MSQSYRDYLQAGWRGELTIKQLCGGLCLESNFFVIAYFIPGLFYFFAAFSDMGSILETLVLFAAGGLMLLYYIWLLKSFWACAIHIDSLGLRYLLRLFVLFLPVISCLIFFLYIMYYVFIAIANAFS